MKLYLKQSSLTNLVYFAYSKYQISSKFLISRILESMKKITAYLEIREKVRFV